MFKFLKGKLKSSIGNISKKIEEEGEEKEVEEELKEEIKEVEEEPKEKEEIKEVVVEKQKIKDFPTSESKDSEEPEKKSFFSKVKERFSKKLPEEKGFEEVQPKEVKKAEEKVKEKKERGETPKIQELVERKEEKGVLHKIKQKIVTKKINEKQFDDLFWNLETVLLESNVALDVIEKIKEDMKNDLVDKPIKRSKIEETIAETLKESIKSLFDVELFDLIKKLKQKKPFVICFVGINGSGKTTTIAKIAKLLQDNKLSCVLAASDTFRAASIEQLQKHADNLGVRLIKHDYGSDPAAVAFDAVKHAHAKNIDVVLIDTAGRMHSNVDLVEEMKKIIRVANPDLKIFVGESITGNDCVEQAKTFNDAIGIDAIILAKADIDEKGGAAVSVSYVTKKPIIFLGTGQEYSDLKVFDKDIVINSLGLEA